MNLCGPRQALKVTPSDIVLRLRVTMCASRVSLAPLNALKKTSGFGWLLQWSQERQPGRKLERGMRRAEFQRGHIHFFGFRRGWGLTSGRCLSNVNFTHAHIKLLLLLVDGRKVGPRNSPIFLRIFRASRDISEPCGDILT